MEIVLISTVSSNVNMSCSDVKLNVNDLRTGPVSSATYSLTL